MPRITYAQAVPSPQEPPARAQHLFALANEARAIAGVGRLNRDPALAGSALKHCLRMSVAGPIVHRYAGEPDLTARAGELRART